MVQREAVFAISIATEEFIARLAEAGQREAARHGRATVQHDDLGTSVTCPLHILYVPRLDMICTVTCVRRGEEFAFLEGTYGCLELDTR